MMIRGTIPAMQGSTKHADMRRKCFIVRITQDFNAMQLKKILLSAMLFVLIPSAALAFSEDYDPGVWVYNFHFEIKSGVLSSFRGAPLPYEAMPVAEFPAPKSPSDSDYRIDIISGKGVLLGSFGFDDPKTIVAALGASVFDVKVPFFANGGKALIYDRSKKKLIEISLTGSSFCNDNGICDPSVGETYLNCANDCPAPIVPTITPGTQPDTPSSAPTTSPSSPTITPPSPVVNSTGGEATVTHTQGDAPERKSVVIPMTIGVGTMLLAVVGLVYWRRRGTE